MSTQSKSLIAYSESSVSPTHFAVWASWVSFCLATFGWSQTTDTGAQLAQWFTSGGSCTGALNTYGGNYWTYTFPAMAGTSSYPLPLPGGAVVFSGFTLGAVGNNGTFIVAPFPVAGNPTSTSITVTNTTGTTTVTGAGVMAPVPSSSGYTTGVNTSNPPANAANTAYWEVWTPGDALAAIYPYYVKIWYGQYSVGSQEPEVWLQLGNGTDGAGNLMGNITLAYYSHTRSAAASSANAFPCYASGDNSRFSFALFDNSSGDACFIFSVERSKNQSGADTATYAHVIQLGSDPSTWRQQALFPPSSPYGSAGIAEVSTLLCALPATASTFSFGATVGVSPVWPHLGCLGNPVLGVVAYLVSDFVDQMLFSASLYGNSHTYLPISLPAATMSPTPATTNGKLAIRYE